MKLPKYDMEAVGRAGTRLVLRLAVAGYLVYLAWSILSGALSGETTIPPWGSWAIAAAFTLFALFFSIYSLREFLRTKKASVFPEQPPEEEEQED